MPDETDRDCRLAVIVTHPDRDAILMVPALDDASLRALPSTTIPSDASVRDWIDAVADLLGTSAVLLRHDTVSSLGHDHPTLIAVEIEPVVPRALDGDWRSIDTLAIDAIEPEIRPTVERWRRRHRDGLVSPRSPWSRTGWFARASTWMIETLVAAGREPTGPPVQHYQWSITSVLRCPTTAGDTYLKATSVIFPQETAVTALLATRTPGLTPVVIATEPTEGWLLMADHGGRPLGEEPEASWAAGLATHARIQRAWADDLDRVRDAGAPDRSLATLSAAAVELGEDDARMARLDPAMRVAYRAAVPQLIDACGRLERFGIGPGLVHGDLHPHNVAYRDDGCVVFDWSDVAVGHPFIDLVPYLFRSTDLATRRASRDAYLAEWADVAPLDHLLEAATLALPLGCLYQVVAYIGILTALGEEDVDDMADADVDWIGRTVRVLEQGIETRRED